MPAAAALPAPTVRKETHATVTTGYSAVSFVPTDSIQTAVSDYGDHIVIDTIIPPSRYLPPTLSVANLASQIQENLVDELGRLGLGMGSRVASVAHPRSREAEAEQFVRGPHGELLDPALMPQNRSEYTRARLGIRSLRGEPLLTYFPSPKGAAPAVVNGKSTTCPCVCCRSGCAGADPATGRLQLLSDHLAKDVNGNIIVDVPSPTAATAPAAATAAAAPAPTTAPAATAASRVTRRPSPPRTAAGPMGISTLGRPFYESKPTTSTLHTARSMGDLRGATRAAAWPSQPPVSAARAPGRRVGADAAPARAGAAGAPPTHVDPGMELFSSLNSHENLASTLTLHNLSSLSLSPEMGRTTPPLSSPSSVGSTPRVPDSRFNEPSPPRTGARGVPVATPVAARYSRSMSNLRRKAHEQELPPLPPLPSTLASPPVAPAVSDAYDAHSSRVRILSGHAPLMHPSALGYVG